MEATDGNGGGCSEMLGAPKWRRQSVGGARVPILHKMSGCMQCEPDDEQSLIFPCMSIALTL